jgi:hypothetical protein
MEREQAISGRDMVIFFLALAALYGLFHLGKRLFFPPPAFERYTVVSRDGSGCVAEVWAKGKSGDRLFRLKSYGKRGKQWVQGVAISHPDLRKTELAMTVSTSSGDCRISRYHLTVDGHEIDTLEMTH